MKAKNISGIFHRFFGGQNSVKLIAFIGLLAIFLIFLSGIIPSESNKKDETSIETEKALPADNTAQAEKRLSELLSNIRGVGKTEIILSLESSEEYIFAEEAETETEQTDTGHSESTKNKLFVSDNSGNKEALVRKVLSPRYNGALVICEGGNDQLVKERVIKAVSAALDLPTNKICVECRIS